MISGQKLWAGCGSGSSLAGEKSAWQPLPTDRLGWESWRAGAAAAEQQPVCARVPLFSVQCSLPFPQGR